MNKLNEVARMQQLAGINEIRINDPRNKKILMNISNIINNQHDHFEMDDEDIMADALGGFEDDLAKLVEDTYGSDMYWEDIVMTPEFVKKLKELVESYPELSPKLLPLFN